MKYQNFSPKKKSYTINFRIQIVTIYIPPKKVWSVRKDRNLFLKARATPSRRHDRRAWRHPPSPWPTTTRSPTVSQQRQKDVTSTGFSRSLRVFFQEAARVFPSLCFVCESMLLEAVSQKHKVTLYEKDSVLPSCYILFSPGLIYIYIYQLGKKSASVRGRRTITLRTMRQFTSVPSGNRLSDSSNEKRRIIVVQRRTRDRPKCTVNVQLSTLSDCH